uniref:Uncharacterized protein n=1 Tax=viral metagenome TaxID=1070528 RepID=A0A6C0DQR4_9ZZZZ
MTKTLDYYIAKLPMDVGKEIFSFLIPDKDTIQFYNYSSNSYSNSSYSSKYEKALIGDEVVKNKEGLYLSRIWKKNGKHRYYVTETIVDTIHVEYNDSMCAMHYYDYFSTYVGKDLDKALIELLFIFQ